VARRQPCLGGLDAKAESEAEDGDGKGGQEMPEAGARAEDQRGGESEWKKPEEVEEDVGGKDPVDGEAVAEDPLRRKGGVARNHQIGPGSGMVGGPGSGGLPERIEEERRFGRGRERPALKSGVPGRDDLGWKGGGEDREVPDEAGPTHGSVGRIAEDEAPLGLAGGKEEREVAPGIDRLPVEVEGGAAGGMDDGEKVAAGARGGHGARKPQGAPAVPVVVALHEDEPFVPAGQHELAVVVSVMEDEKEPEAVGVRTGGRGRREGDLNACSRTSERGGLSGVEERRGGRDSVLVETQSRFTGHPAGLVSESEILGMETRRERQGDDHEQEGGGGPPVMSRLERGPQRLASPWQPGAMESGIRHGSVELCGRGGRFSVGGCRALEEAHHGEDSGHGEEEESEEGPDEGFGGELD